MDRLTGLIAATFTPMHPDGSVDLAPVPAMVEGLLRNGITALYVCGSTGEGPSLTTEERERVLADIRRQDPKFIIAKPERVAEQLKTPSSPSSLAFYQYLVSQYEEVDPGLYRRR